MLPAVSSTQRRPCVCCGRLTLDGRVAIGGYAVCPVCGWEDDAVQLRWPYAEGGANGVALVEAQRNYRDFGAKDHGAWDRVRQPREDEAADGAWRAIDPERDFFADPDDTPRRDWPDDLTVLCWWLPAFWGRRPA